MWTAGLLLILLVLAIPGVLLASYLYEVVRAWWRGMDWLREELFGDEHEEVRDRL